MRRRLLLTAAVATAVAVPLAIAGGADTKPAKARRVAPPAAHAKPAYTYASARGHGQPIAILRRRVGVRATPGGRRVEATIPRRTEWGTLTVLAALAERHGWLRVLATQLHNGQSGWIPAAAAGVVASPWRIEADLSRRLVTVRREGRAVRRFRVAVGRPSTPTPTGRFAITDKLRFTDHSRAYGWGAIALTGHQTHIEPGWKGGDRLAIHGTSDQASIGLAASFGCLRARDADVRWLVHHAYLGSVMTIRP